MRSVRFLDIHNIIFYLELQVIFTIKTIEYNKIKTDFRKED